MSPSPVLSLCSSFPQGLVANPWYRLSISFRQQLVFLGSLAVVSALVWLWALFFRKRRRRRSRHYSPGIARSSAPSNGQRQIFSRSKRRKRRRRRGEERARNPTLAETRGLPAIRSQGRSGAES